MQSISVHVGALHSFEGAVPLSKSFIALEFINVFVPAIGVPEGAPKGVKFRMRNGDPGEE